MQLLHTVCIEAAQAMLMSSRDSRLLRVMPAGQLHMRFRFASSMHHCGEITHFDVQLWAVRIEAAQAPLLMSSRDGRLLRPVPVEVRLTPGALREALTLAAGGRLAADARSLLCGAWRRGALLRGMLSDLHGQVSHVVSHGC